jgi:predicted nucleic acid-binding protein
MRRFFDTNVLVYAHGRDDPVKRDLARASIDEATAEDGFVVSTQVLAEFYRTAVRLKVMGPAQARDLVRVWSEHDTVVQTPELLLRAISLHQDHSLAFWDAMIIQAALESRCDVVMTEDMQHGRRFGDLEIVNPFIAPRAHEPSPAAYSAGRVRKRRRVRKTA